MMGDRVARARPKELEERLQKAKERRERNKDDLEQQRQRKKMAELQSNVLAAEVDTVYR